MVELAFVDGGHAMMACNIYQLAFGRQNTGDTSLSSLPPGPDAARKQVSTPPPPIIYRLGWRRLATTL